MAHLKSFLLDTCDPGWTIAFTGEAHAPPTMPKDCALYRHNERKLTVMVAVEDNGFLHVSVSTHTGLPATNEECQWLADNILVSTLHFQEAKIQNIEKIREAVKKHTGSPIHPIVRHFYHRIGGEVH